MTLKKIITDPVEDLAAYRVWIDEMESLGRTHPVHLNISDDYMTFCGITMVRPGYWWSNGYNKPLTLEGQLSCKRCLKKLRSKQNAETLEALLSV